MRTSITHAVLLTVALAACSADSGTALAPSVPGFARSAEADTKTKHISGQLEAVEAGVITVFPVINRRLEGTGTASQLGRFTVVGDVRLNVLTASGTGTGTYTAANGDVLAVSSVGQAVIAAGIGTVTETVTVTGGTGRFDGATGTLTVVRRVVQATGISTGTITLPK